MKKLLIAILAGALAQAAIVSDGITYKPFIRGMEHRAHPVWTEEFKGREWQCGDETCSAGLHFHPIAWGTGT